MPLNEEPPFKLVDAELAGEEAERLFEQVRKSLEPCLPFGSEIRHIGATAVPGCLTKGDLDIVIRVPAGAFRIVDAALADLFRRNTGSVRTETFSAFEDGAASPPLGIQLTVFGGAHDHFHLFVEALRRSPDLVSDYNDLKRRYDDQDMATYRDAKDAFVQRVLAIIRW